MSGTVSSTVRIPASGSAGVASNAFERAAARESIRPQSNLIARAGEQGRRVVEARLVTKLRCIHHLLGRETSIAMLFNGSEKGAVAVQKLVGTIESVTHGRAALENVEKELRVQALEVKEFFFWLRERIDSGESRESLLVDYAPPEFSLGMLRANASNCVLLMDKLAAVLDGAHVEAKLSIQAFMISDQVASVLKRAGAEVGVEHAHEGLQSVDVRTDYSHTVAELAREAGIAMNASDGVGVTIRVEETPSGAVVFRVLSRGAEEGGVQPAEREHFAVHAERAEN